MALQSSLSGIKEMSDKKRFKLKHFDVWQSADVFKIGTDAFVLGSWANLNSPPSTILDIGTGTGILSLMLAQKYPKAQITAIDANKNAIELAKANVQQSPFHTQIKVCHDGFEQFQSEQRFELIISNPPYFVDAVLADSQVLATAKHLNSNSVNELFACIQRQLAPHGVAILIHPNDGVFEEQALIHGLHVQKQLRVFGVADRLVRVCNCYGFEKCEQEIIDLVIRDSGGRYTAAYKSLTREFHGVAI